MTEPQVASLGVARVPDWLKYYQGAGGEPGPDNAWLASKYNQIGAFSWERPKPGGSITNDGLD